jgi:serine phosphatase RsbU (regulator of sigma subunit)
LSVVSVIGVAVAGLFATALRQRREAELANVRSIAEVAQRVLLRPVPLRARHLRVAVSYTSAVAEARIGGDLYEVVTSPGGTRVIVGDVQGKGLEAVETAAVVLGAFREAAHDEPDLTGVSARLERALNRRLSGEEFVTAVLAEVNDDQTVTLLNYGHPAPLILRTDGTHHFAEPAETAPPLGLADFGPKGPVPFQVPLAPGDQMLLYTDGVTEAHLPRHELFGEHRLTAALRELAGSDPAAVVRGLLSDLHAHVGDALSDDLCIVAARVQPT